MFCIRMAGFSIRFHNRQDGFRKLCEDYLIENVKEPDFDVPAPDEEMIGRRWYFQNDRNQEIRDKEQVEHCITPFYYLYPQLPRGGGRSGSMRSQSSWMARGMR